MSNRIARLVVLVLLGRLRDGRIEIAEAGRRRAFGPADAELRATLTVNDPAAWRGALRGSVGLGEDYLEGRWEADDLVALLRIAARELQRPSRLRGALARARGLAHRLRRLVPENSRRGARENISAHYDLGNELFSAFLDERMMYSCALFPPAGASLEEAQLAKLERICAKLELGPDDHLLEIGTRLGRARRARGARARLPGDDDDDLARAAPAWRSSGCARPGWRTGSPCCWRTTATCAAATTSWSRSR